ncbi:MAG: hypothetical protein N2Z65_04345 [Clostridiales bacterium]|nr:hypothetical protein [Clostridiales bacterium]
MKSIFITAFILFFIAEVLIIINLYSKKKKVGSKSSVISVILFLALLFFRTILTLNIPYYVLLFSLIAIFLDSFFGYYLELYYSSTKFDRFVHAYSMFSYALLLFFLLTNFIEIGGSKLFQALFIMFLGISYGVFFEIIEFRSDSKNNTKMQRGLKDTNYDMIFNIIGSIVAAVFAYIIIL